MLIDYRRDNISISGGLKDAFCDVWEIYLGRHRCVFFNRTCIEPNSTPYFIYTYMCPICSWIASPDMDINVLQHVHLFPRFSIPSVALPKIPILSIPTCVHLKKGHFYVYNGLIKRNICDRAITQYEKCGLFPQAFRCHFYSVLYIWACGGLYGSEYVIVLFP